ncbi:phosphopantetheine-binding protein [Prosthecobacter sp.]|uniref:acyl carrier protein n=1 Tax=Prosthecobacter sp. TaxID=1965333 RepID=UPI002489E544|nr:phosphopantetheine-binding protein [Prosthecobacter sp.]MDI1310852.1 phosphopantetheine-binding protein [Prosthecobacter sp.]
MNKIEFHRLIDEIIESPPATITGNEILSEIAGWDSLTVVAFLAAFDKQFGAPPPPQALAACRTVADLAALAGDKLAD